MRTFEEKCVCEVRQPIKKNNKKPKQSCFGDWITVYLLVNMEISGSTSREAFWWTQSVPVHLKLRVWGGGREKNRQKSQLFVGLEVLKFNIKGVKKLVY